MEKLECDKLIEKINEMIADEEMADEEYNRLIKQIRNLKPKGTMQIISDIDTIAGDEFKHKLKLIEIRDDLKNQCGWL